MRELREDCLSEASSAAPAQLASRAGDRRRLADDSDAGCPFSLLTFSLGMQRESQSPSKGENIAISTYDNEHFAVPSGNFIAVNSVPRDRRECFG